MKKNVLIIFVLLLFVTKVISQTAGYDIKVKINGVEPNKYIHLAHYYGYNSYIKVDSAKSVDGIFHFLSLKNNNIWLG